MWLANLYDGMALISFIIAQGVQFYGLRIPKQNILGKLRNTIQFCKFATGACFFWFGAAVLKEYFEYSILFFVGGSFMILLAEKFRVNLEILEKLIDTPPHHKT